MFPINIFSLSDLGIYHDDYLKKLKLFYGEYEYDEYLYRQNIIQSFLSRGWLNVFSDKKFIEDFYLGGDLDLFKNRVPIELESFPSIIKYRRRMVCYFKVSKSGEVKRHFPSEFKQAKAIKSDDGFDFRIYPRKFKDAPDELIDDDTIKIVKYFSYIIFNRSNKCSEIIVSVHYTIIDAIDGNKTSNSPEGIHQDGMDFIISALVMERVNIKGGVSNIYYPNVSNKIIEVELKEGFGLFHQDLNTDIWHEVTNIEPKNVILPGYRSTIGFDFEVIG